jgi:hypothetical protein
MLKKYGCFLLILPSMRYHSSQKHAKELKVYMHWPKQIVQPLPLEKPLIRIVKRRIKTGELHLTQTRQNHRYCDRQWKVDIRQSYAEQTKNDETQNLRVTQPLRRHDFYRRASDTRNKVAFQGGCDERFS